MKRRNKITNKIRDGWIENWKRANQNSAHYVSFIKTQDMKSLGSKSRTPDFDESGQDRDFLSTNERHFFYRLRFSRQFVWIKEQYPLLSIERGVAIAKALGVRYPTYPYSANVQVVMTTDFYCQQINGKKVAYSIKDQKAFEKLTDKQKENLEAKQKLEKVFWESQGVKWYLVMSEDIKTIFSQNLEKLYPSSSLSTSLKLIITRWQIRFFDLISERPKSRFSDILNSLASEFGIDYFDSVEIFQYCVWHRKIYANLSERLLEFEFSPNALGIRGVN